MRRITLWLKRNDPLEHEPVWTTWDAFDTDTTYKKDVIDKIILCTLDKFEEGVFLTNEELEISMKLTREQALDLFVSELNKLKRVNDSSGKESVYFDSIQQTAQRLKGDTK